MKYSENLTESPLCHLHHMGLIALDDVWPNDRRHATHDDTEEEHETICLNTVSKKVFVYHCDTFSTCI